MGNSAAKFLCGRRSLKSHTERRNSYAKNVRSKKSEDSLFGLKFSSAEALKDGYPGILLPPSELSPEVTIIRRETAEKSEFHPEKAQAEGMESLSSSENRVIALRVKIRIKRSELEAWLAATKTDRDISYEKLFQTSLGRKREVQEQQEKRWKPSLESISEVANPTL